MDIVRRAYTHIIGVPPEGDPVRAEVIRLIQALAYTTRSWPREWGPLPDALRSRRPSRDGRH